MSKKELKTLQSTDTAKKGREYLATNIRFTFELKQEGVEATYNAMGKLIERSFERVVDSKWMGADIYDNNISSDEITLCDVARQLKKIAEWANKQAEILCPSESEDNSDNLGEVAK